MFLAMAVKKTALQIRAKGNAVSPSMQTAKKPEWQTLHPRFNLISILLLNFKMDILNRSLLIIIFKKQGGSGIKTPHRVSA